jgi:Putative Flp pilus-assembly TadE/G-like
MRAARWEEDGGSLSVLILGLVAVLVVLVTVVVNASKAFLVQRSLSAAADGAAVAAANALDETAVYGGGLTDTVPLDARAVRATVLAYADDAALVERFVGFSVVEASTDGTTATVTMTALVRMPLVSAVSERYADGYPVEVTASARSPLGD